MLAANPNAGVYYIVNPNNPSGTITPMADIEWLVDNKPAGSIVLIDEAYIHWSDAYPNNTASHLAAAGQGRDHPAHLLQDFRHGGRADGLFHWPGPTWSRRCRRV